MGKLRIVSYREAAFADRAEAGRALARELAEVRGQAPVVLGIPRGGMIVARELALELQGDLDLVLARKLRTPGQWELAMGSVSEDGRVFLNERVLRSMNIGAGQIEEEKVVQLHEIARRREFFRSGRPKVPLQGRLVIVTDDGVATGATAQAALWAARQERPSKVIAAFPVGPVETLERLSVDADETLCLRSPPFFFAVGQFYRRFDPVEDEDVLALLRRESAREQGKSRPIGRPPSPTQLPLA